MLSIRKPPVESIRRQLSALAETPLTYAEVGATADKPPAGYVVDRTRIRLGEGEETFQAAKKALESWRQFQLGWVEASPVDTPIVVGRAIGVTGHAVGLWWLNFCRIVYVINEDIARDAVRFGFAYGTLPQHVQRGEERFLIEWNRADDSVWYDILAFSRPRHLLAKLGYAQVRKAQKRFGRDSAAAMCRAVGTPLPFSVEQESRR